MKTNLSQILSQIHWPHIKSGVLSFGIILLIPVIYQNCSQARFAKVGEESQTSSGVGDLGTGGNTSGGTGSDSGSGSGGNSSGGGTTSPGAGSNNELSDVFYPGCKLDEEFQLCGPELVLNGDFEVLDRRVGLVNGLSLNKLSQKNPWDVYATLPGEKCEVSWYAEDGTSGIEIQAGTSGSAPSGRHYVELDSHGNKSRGNNSNSGMYQEIELTESAKFCLAFKYRGRAQSEDDNAIQVSLGQKAKIEVAEKGSYQWEDVDLRIRLEKGSQTLKFKAIGLASTYGGLLDQVSIRKLCKK